MGQSPSSYDFDSYENLSFSASAIYASNYPVPTNANTSATCSILKQNTAETNADNVSEKRVSTLFHCWTPKMCRSSSVLTSVENMKTRRQMIKKQRNIVYTVKNVIFFTKCLKTTITMKPGG